MFNGFRTTRLFLKWSRSEHMGKKGAQASPTATRPRGDRVGKAGRAGRQPRSRGTAAGDPAAEGLTVL